MIDQGNAVPFDTGLAFFYIVSSFEGFRSHSIPCIGTIQGATLTSTKSLLRSPGSSFLRQGFPSISGALGLTLGHPYEK